jgi:hypothetical protein
LIGVVERLYEQNLALILAIFDPLLWRAAYVVASGAAIKTAIRLTWISLVGCRRFKLNYRLSRYHLN